MTLAATFLAGAGSRLLPASLPFRFFGAAVAFHVVAWVAALAGAASVPSFAGGLGWPLAALHAVTLGVLAMTVIGASLQLFPVATRRPVPHARFAVAIFWTYAPAVAALVAGMGFGVPVLMAAGAAAIVVAFIAYLGLLGRTLAGAAGMPLVVAHGAVAALCLCATLASALMLVGTYAIGAAVDRQATLIVHVVLAGYGFMGMMALGLSYVLVPMFALSEAPDARRGWASFALAVLALACGAGASSGVERPLLGAIAAVAGAAAVAVHVALMREALLRGLRRELGPGFRLVRVAWGAALASLALAAALALDVPWPPLATLFGATLIVGWLLTFVLGVLQRIVPFLASMHAARGQRRPPTPSSLTDERALRVHFHAHLGALALLGVAIVADSPALALAAGACGTVAAIAYATFFVHVLSRSGVRVLRP